VPAALAVRILIMMLWGTLALHANALFGFAGRGMGYLSAFAAAVGIASQVALLRLLTRRVAERPILAGALVAMCAGQLLLAAADAPPALLAGVALMAGAFNVAMPTAMGPASRLAAEHEQGALMGTLSSAVRAASVAGPVAGGLLFGFSPRGSRAVAAAAALAASAATVWAGCTRRAPTTSYGS
jgi:MFS family permease